MTVPSEPVPPTGPSGAPGGPGGVAGGPGWIPGGPGWIPGGPGGPVPPAVPRRTRVVLAEAARARAGLDRTRAELSEQTRVGEVLLRGLVRAQIALALRLATVVAIGLGALPLLFAVAPAVGTTKVFGINLPWLLLGVVAYPFLIVVGWVYIHLAERNEQDFTALVQRPER